MADRGHGDFRGGRGGRGGQRGGGGNRGGGPGGGRGGGGHSDRGGGGRGSGGGGFNNRGGGGRGGSGGYIDRGGNRGRGGFFDRGGRGGGGRGGRGGGRSASPGREKTFKLEGPVSVPQVDPVVDELEDQIIKKQAASIADLTSKMGKIKLGSSSSQPVESTTNPDHFPPRPAFGTNGVAVLLWANYFAVTAKPGTYFKYTMRFSQRVGDGTYKLAEPKGRKLRLVVQAVVANLGTKYPDLALATEFKSQLVTVTQLKDSELLVTLPDGPSPEVYKVEFDGPTEARVDDMKTWISSMAQGQADFSYPRFLETVDALNVILGFGPRSKDTVAAVGRGRIFPFDRMVQGDNFVNLSSDSRPLVAARGLFHSARLGTGRLLLNANVTYGVFKVSGPVVNIFKALGLRPMTRAAVRSPQGKQFNMVSKFLPKTRVTVEMKLDSGKIIHRNKAIYGLARASEISRSFKGDHRPKFDAEIEYPGPFQVQFWLDDGKGGGKYITVGDYYKAKYGRKVEDLPLLNLGRNERPTFYPAEVVTITPGQPVKVKLTGSETTDMLAFACHSPYFNATQISTSGRQTLGLDDGSLSKFGITTGKSLLVVRGRVLSVPAIQYLEQRQQKTAKQVRPNNGSWNMQNCRIVKPGKMISKWGFINVHNRRPNVVEADTVRDFAKFMQGTGILINAEPISMSAQNGRETSLDRVAFENTADQLFQRAKKAGFQFILVVIDERDTQGLYAYIKVLGDCVYGIHTSIVIGNKFKPLDRNTGEVKRGNQLGYFANVALKWNLKAGGANHALSNELGLIKEGKTMIVGYDVTHPTNMPAGTDTDIPSIAGLVASIDKQLGQWPSVAWEQASRREMVKGRLVEVFKSRLDLWFKNNKAFPENIVIFRDGVSKGQFAQVLDQELPDIREACRVKYGNKAKQPKISIVVSVKRHQTRFYPTDPARKTDSGNIQPGTVVDRGVTQARYWDFFLTAHNALQGTARPAHYTVLLDEIFRARYGVNAANELEKMTHELCYLYGRATKAVSICPPAYYADIVCERARAHRPDMFDVSDTASFDGGGGGHAAARGTNTRDVHPDLKDTMYYM